MRIIHLGTFLGIVLAMPVTTGAQAEAQKNSQILIPIVVTDYKDRYVNGLEKRDFQVFENGIERVITDFPAQQTGPISVTFVMDLYGDKGNERVEEVASQLLDAAEMDDEFAVVDFKNGLVAASGFTQDYTEVKKAITTAHQETLSPLLDGLRAAIDGMKKAKNPRQFIVIVSDGNPHSRVYSRQELDTLVDSTAVPIYSISRNFVEISDVSAGEAAARAGLDELARRSGGYHFTLDTTPRTQNLGQRIAIGFRNSYLVQYQSQGGSVPYRQIEVQIHNQKVQFLWARHRPTETVEK